MTNGMNRYPGGERPPVVVESTAGATAMAGADVVHFPDGHNVHVTPGGNPLYGTEAVRTALPAVDQVIVSN